MLNWHYQRHGDVHGLVAGVRQLSPAMALGRSHGGQAGQEHLQPDGRAVRVSLRTLQRWVVRFRRQKLAGLMRPERKDDCGSLE